MAQDLDYSALFDASPYPYLLVDTGFVIIGANPSYLRATGRTAKDIVGKHIFDAFPSNPSDPDSTNLDEVRFSIELAISTRKPHTSALLRYAVPRETPEGTVFDERYWSAVHTPVFNERREVAFVAQNAIDVTDLYRFDENSRRYFLKKSLNAVPDVTEYSRAQLHEAMTRIVNMERNQLRILFNQAPGFIAVMMGASHVFEMANEAYYRLVGQRDLLGKPVWEALPELAGQGFEELLDSVFESGKPIVMRGRKIVVQREAAGPPSERYIDFLCQPIFGEDGRVMGVLAQGHDVTDAHEAASALAEKIQQLEEARTRQAFQLRIADLLRNLSDHSEIFARSSELIGRHFNVNRVLYGEYDAARSMVSFHSNYTDGTASELRGAFPASAFGAGNFASLEGGAVWVCDDLSTDPRTAEQGIWQTFEALGIYSGVVVPLTRRGAMIACLFVNVGQPRHWTENEVSLLKDVADRVWNAVERARAEAQLRVQTEKLQIATSAAQLGLFDHNILTGEIDWDARTHEHVGHPQHVQIGRESFLEHVHPDDREPLRQLLGALYAPGSDGRVNAEYRTAGHDGRLRWIAAKGQMFYDAAGHPARLVGITMDITERKQSEQELKEAGRRKDEFLAMLAHELRNPLAPISAAAELLQLAKLDQARVRLTSEIIGRQVRHMTHLVDDLLDVSRVTRGLIELDKGPLDIRHILDDAIEQVMPLIQLRHQRLALHLAPDSTVVTGDRKRLVQVIANLLNNAAKYTQEHGNIVLKTEVRAAHVLLEVADDGIGMAPQLVSRVFELFAQAERTSDRSSGGLGLGLALVKSLVELHGGSVTCSSAGLGQGSRFTVCLPRMHHPDEPPDPRPNEQHLQGTARPLRIMVVDDNVDAAAMLAMLVETSGHQVLVEHGSRRALERARVEAPDVFLLDIGLPDMDGNQLAQRLRAQPENARSVLVAVTGYGQDSDRGLTLASGFDYHLVKPVSTAKLAAILAEAGKS